MNPKHKKTLRKQIRRRLRNKATSITYKDTYTKNDAKLLKYVCYGICGEVFTVM